MYLFIPVFMYSFIHLFKHLFIYSCIYSCIYLYLRHFKSSILLNACAFILSPCEMLYLQELASVAWRQEQVGLPLIYFHELAHKH